MKEYRTVESAANFAFTEKKSRFIGHCYPIRNEAEAEERLATLKKAYWDARHNCYALRLGLAGGTARSSDDGEPSGTAGAPILNVLMQSGITDAIVVVTRYFGGVLLGAGGLIRAYSRAASGALRAAGVISMRFCTKVSVEVPYSLYQTADRCFRNYACEPEADFSEIVCVSAYVPETDLDALKALLIDRSDGKCVPTIGDSKYLPFPVEHPEGLLGDESNEDS